MLLREDAYNQPGDFGHDHFANYPKFVQQKKITVPLWGSPGYKIFPPTCFGVKDPRGSVARGAGSDMGKGVLYIGNKFLPYAISSGPSFCLSP